jgi:nitrite reductase/ring-hydroxylating ferredoxin subunit
MSELEQLSPVVVTLDGCPITIVRVESEVYAFSAMCSHRAAPMVEGAVTWKRTILCPWHLGTFDLRTGRAMAGPPKESIPIYPTVVVGGEVYLDADPRSLPVVQSDLPALAGIAARSKAKDEARAARAAEAVEP